MLSTFALYAATFLMGLVSGTIPFVINLEIYLLGVVALSTAPVAAIVGLATAGQMLAAYILYLAGRGVLGAKFINWKRREAAVRAFEKYRSHSLALVAISSVMGFPPFYGVSLAAGTVRFPMARFLVVGVIGRAVRFTLVCLAPSWLHLKG